MKKIILGTMGNQPFKISGGGVSGEHATVTIDDHGNWSIADMGSTNGTFLRDDATGELSPVGTTPIHIHPMTFIVLGSDDSMGCRFYARQVLKPGDFNDEHLYICDKHQQLNAQEQKSSSITKRIKQFTFIAMLGITILSFEPHVIEWLGGNSKMFNFYRIFSLASSGVGAFYDGKSLKDKVKRKRKLFNQCPNPQCSHHMSASEIEDKRCAKCGK